ncbi:hypothetical protein TNCT_635531 [Trichonephila clavata]|uniref:Uncharacterized protein n=1 Tax=Trichonephila clavata TaxID=2740835 RepID=A0A8X6FLY6_TRICU|nr:hypothetical protein TNCT_635531 [Trichonephila clavata]
MDEGQKKVSWLLRSRPKPRCGCLIGAGSLSGRRHSSSLSLEARIPSSCKQAPFCNEFLFFSFLRSLSHSLREKKAFICINWRLLCSK